MQASSARSMFGASTVLTQSGSYPGTGIDIAGGFPGHGNLLQSFVVCCRSDSDESFLVRMELPRAVLWRPEALDCRALIPPETRNGSARNPPSLGCEPRTSSI